LHWIALDRTGLHWIALDCTGLRWIGQGWTRLDKIGQDRTRLDKISPAKEKEVFRNFFLFFPSTSVPQSILAPSTFPQKLEP
jgi:hypothetical protein